MRWLYNTTTNYTNLYYLCEIFIQSTHRAALKYVLNYANNILTMSNKVYVHISSSLHMYAVLDWANSLRHSFIYFCLYFKYKEIRKKTVQNSFTHVCLTFVFDQLHTQFSARFINASKSILTTKRPLSLIWSPR